MSKFLHLNRFRLAVSFLSVIFFLSFVVSGFAAGEGKVTFEKEDGGVVTVFVDGEFFAQYRPDADGTPIVWPICSDAGTLLTRGYPMDQAEDPVLAKTSETKNILKNSKLDSLTANKDHIHHRSLWFNFGNVNDIDFWGPDAGRIVQTEMIDLSSTDHSVTIKTRNAWIPTPGAKPVCVDLRTFTFACDPAHPCLRWIDYDIELTAAADSVTFFDTKEGMLGFRTPGSMDVEAVKRSDKWGGHILNNLGEKDDQTWGKRASWVDYFGPAPRRLSDAELDQMGENADPAELPLTEAGIVIMNHPKSFRYPSWYHVRTYGLFAVNPIGIHDFEPNSRLNGSVTLEKDDELTFRYRILFHDQKLSAEELNGLFDAYKTVP